MKTTGRGNKGFRAPDSVERLFAALEDHGISYRELAQELGCSKSLISRVRANRYVPPTRPDIVKEIRGIAERRMGTTQEEKNKNDFTAEAQRAQRKTDKGKKGSNRNHDGRDGRDGREWTGTEDEEPIRQAHGLREEMIDMADLRPVSLSREYLRAHGLSADPFEEIGEIFEGREWKRGIEEIRRAIERQTFIAVEAQVGWGKSTLKDFLIGELKLSAPHILIAETIANQKNELTANQILEAIFFAIGIEGGLCGRTRERRARFLRDRLESVAEDGKIVVIVVDDAHRLPPTTFRELKLFTELMAGFRKLLGLVLIGQLPELGAQLGRIREAGWRARRLELDGLRDEVGDYVRSRIIAVGGNTNDIVEPRALKRFAELMRGASPYPLDYPLPVNAALSMLMQRTWNLGERVITREAVEIFFGLGTAGRISKKEATEEKETKENTVFTAEGRRPETQRKEEKDVA